MVLLQIIRLVGESLIDFQCKVPLIVQAIGFAFTVEIDMKLDMLSYLKGVIVLGRNIQNPDYNQVFDETARRIYEVITGRGCPKSMKVM